MTRVELSKRVARKSGMVVRPARRYLGTKYRAPRTIANAAVVSQAITAIVWLNASPFSPMRCSVDRLVSIREPAMTQAVRPLPARK